MLLSQKDFASKLLYYNILISLVFISYGISTISISVFLTILKFVTTLFAYTTEKKSINANRVPTGKNLILM